MAGRCTYAIAVGHPVNTSQASILFLVLFSILGLLSSNETASLNPGQSTRRKVEEMGTKAQDLSLLLQIERQIGVYTHVKFLLASLEMDRAVFE